MSAPKRRGRPRLEPAVGPSAPVNIRVAPTDYDALTKVAALRRETVQDVIRRSIRRDPEVAARRASTPI